MGHTEPLQHHREWRFKDEGEAERFDAALAKAISSCLENLERNGHGFLVSRANSSETITRRLESESGELLACVKLLMDLPDPFAECQGNPSSDGGKLVAKSGDEQSVSILLRIE